MSGEYLFWSHAYNNFLCTSFFIFGITEFGHGGCILLRGHCAGHPTHFVGKCYNDHLVGGTLLSMVVGTK